MTEDEALSKMEKVGAVLTGDHFVYTSSRHGNAYINKDAIFPHVLILSEFCRKIASHFNSHRRDKEVDIVVAPALGAIGLCQWVAYWLAPYPEHYSRAGKILAAYAEEDQETGKRVFRRGFANLIGSKRVLVVEDILTTGGSALKVIEAVRELKGEVIGLGVLCNRGGVTAQDVGNVPDLFALTNVQLDSWSEDKCPLCAKGIPVNTVIGKGKDFAARQKAGQQAR